MSVRLSIRLAVLLWAGIAACTLGADSTELGHFGLGMDLEEPVNLGPAPATATFHLTASTAFRVELVQTTTSTAELQVSIAGATYTSELLVAPVLDVPVEPGTGGDASIVVANHGHGPLTGTLRVHPAGDPVGAGQVDVMFTNPLCHDTTGTGVREGARCTGTEKDLSRDKAGIWRRIIGMIDAARVYKTAHPEAPVTIYMSYLSWYIDAGIMPVMKAALDAGVQFRGYFDSHGDVGTVEALEALNHPNVHLGWLGGHTEGGGTWRLMHIKLTMVDFGVDEEPMQMVFSSANLSPSGTSIHFENYVFASVSRQSNFAQRHLCAMEALEADKYPSRFETDDHEVIFEGVYDECVSHITAPVDPHMMVWFSPDRDAWSQTPDSSLGFIIGRMEQATNGIDMAIEHFDVSPLAEALRGPENGAMLRRRLVLDDQTLYMDGESSTWDNSMWWSVLAPSWARERVAQRFIRTNAEIRQLQHNKYIIVDGRGVFCGAGNFTGAAFADNYENFYYLEDASVVAKFQTHFQHLFDDLGSTLEQIPPPKGGQLEP